MIATAEDPREAAPIRGLGQRLLAGVLMRPRGARLAVPGPVWGARPERSDPSAALPPTRRPRSVPRRGPPASGPAQALARLAGRDASAVARQAEAVASRMDPMQWAAARAQAIARLAADGLSPAALGLALGVAGAALAGATGLKPRPNQYRCAALLLAQRLVELDTGEGKSLAVALAAAVAGLAGAPVHVLTANGYLARRDVQDFGPFFGALGLSVAAVDEAAPDAPRRAAWGADIAYATARIAGFDALRDALAQTSGAPPLLVRGRCVAIVDEADSILVDEARTPLVIAEAFDDPGERVRAWRALDLARRLVPEHDLVLETDARRARLTARGAARLEAAVAHEGEGADWIGARQRTEMVEQAAVALHLLRRDVDYLVRGREVLIVDVSTGRAAPGRQWSRSLHALVALKEGVPVPASSRVRASQTYPRLLAAYHHLCGTSGTLREASAELRRDYGLAVVRVPRTHASRLAFGSMRLFAGRDAQFDAAIARACVAAQRGRAVLVATDSVAESAELAARFARRGVTVEVLDARHDDDEAGRIARAGEAGRITVSTQMAGRGTDIRLSPAAVAAGGLHVLSLQHNRSARIDRQVAGRAARQRDPGSAEHWIRLADSPIDPTRLPPPLGLLVRATGVLVPLAQRAGIGRPGSGRLVMLAWRLCQRWWRFEDAHARSEALRHDTLWSRRLHFATMAAKDQKRLEF